MELGTLAAIVMMIIITFSKKKKSIFIIQTAAEQSPFPKSLLPCPESETDLRKFWKAMHSRKMVLGLKTFNCFPHESYYLSILFYCHVLYFRIYRTETMPWTWSSLPITLCSKIEKKSQNFFLLDRLYVLQNPARVCLVDNDVI